MFSVFFWIHSYVLGGRCGWKSIEFSDLDLLYIFGAKRFDLLWDKGAVLLAVPPLPPPHCSLCLAARNGSVSGHWALGQQALMVLSRLLRGNLTVNKICHILSIHSVFIICTSGSRFLLHSRKVCTSPPSHSSAPWHLPLPL